jgi:hypothetical protein
LGLGLGFLCRLGKKQLAMDIQARKKIFASGQGLARNHAFPVNSDMFSSGL